MLIYSPAIERFIAWLMTSGLSRTEAVRIMRGQ